MTQNPKLKRIPREEVPLHNDVRRLANSMVEVLKRRYPNPVERRIAAVKIMRDLQAA